MLKAQLVTTGQLSRLFVDGAPAAQGVGKVPAVASNNF
jgi:hypothetical protein